MRRWEGESIVNIPALMVLVSEQPAQISAMDYTHKTLDTKPALLHNSSII